MGVVVGIFADDLALWLAIGAGVGLAVGTALGNRGNTPSGPA